MRQWYGAGIASEFLEQNVGFHCPLPAHGFAK